MQLISSECIVTLLFHFETNQSVFENLMLKQMFYRLQVPQRYDYLS